uniref:Uncharacterized protein n=1 Tax=Cucumis melo TaxID=3656 RepID=A0A9I9EBR7_CUCME
MRNATLAVSDCEREREEREVWDSHLRNGPTFVPPLTCTSFQTGGDAPLRLALLLSLSPICYCFNLGSIKYKQPTPII